MRVIYLKYDDEFSKPIVCNYGPVWPITFLGPIYFAIKKDFKYFFITLITQLFVVVLITMFIKNHKIASIINISMIFAINLLFSLNYNLMVIESLLKKNYIPYGQESVDILREKVIYFKLY